MGRPAERQRETAARNVEAILDAAEQLLQEGAAASIAAVAARSGVSRVTVYAHFPAREDLLEAVVRRVVARTHATLAQAAEGGATARERLDRLVSASWTVLQREDVVARAAARELPSSARTRAHGQVLGQVAALVRDAQDEGTVRGDLTPEWLAGVVIALVHAAAEQVQEEAMTPGAARAALRATIASLLDAPA